MKFLIIDSEVGLHDPVNYQKLIYSDNIVQTTSNVFIFEAKVKNEEGARKQLNLYLNALKVHVEEIVKRRLLFPYNLNKIRLFYYSMKRHDLIEFKGKNLRRSAKKFKDLNELKTYLQNIFKGNNL